MKKTILGVFLVSVTSLLSQTKTIELDIKFHNGFGPFEMGLLGLDIYSTNENDPLYKTYKFPKGMPNSWENSQHGCIKTNGYQFIYQNYLSGKISSSYFENSKEKLNWCPTSLNLSDKDLKCSNAFAYIKNKDGVIEMLIDTNNDNDFGDEKIFSPQQINTFADIQNNQSLFLNNYITIEYEREINNNVVTEKIPLSIIYIKSDDILLYNFPQYMTSEIDGTKIAICSNNFIDISANDTQITLINENIDTNSDSKFIGINEFLKINNKLYQNNGINIKKNKLILTEIETNIDNIKSSQIGFKPHNIEGINFINNETLNLENLHSKYVLINFWATWCSPCIAKNNFLKTIYQNVDKSKFEIIGIVSGSNASDFESFINKNGIDWPQILSDKNNDIEKKYAVKGYPTSFLISPDGIIIDKNISNKELEKLVENWIKKEE